MTLAANDLTCQELVELVTEYLEGSLPAEARIEFDEHLAMCDGCANYLDQMRRTIEIAGKLTEASISPQAQESLLGAFRGWKSRPQP